jgi:putative membrane protein insertion efficiency factor
LNLPQHILVFAVRVYRCVGSPVKNALFGELGRCRFTPSCSAFALEAIQKHGALRGVGLALRRLARCHPWGGCGDDPVPPVRSRLPGSHAKFLPGDDWRPLQPAPRHPCNHRHWI